MHSGSVICRINVQLVYSPHSVYCSKVYILTFRTDWFCLSVVILLYPSMPCKLKIVDRFQRMREPHFALAKVCNFLVNLVPRVLSYPSLGTRLSSVQNLDVKWAIYIIIKKTIFIIRTVSALGLVLKVRVFWFLEVVKGLLTAWVSGVSGGKRGKEKRKFPVS